MIKLMDLLLEVKLSPEEQYKQALAILQDETLEEGVMDKLKKLGLSAAVIAALLASPQLTQAQKAPLQQLAKQQTTQTIKSNEANFRSNVAKIQRGLQEVRSIMIGQWEQGKIGIKLGGIERNPNVKEDKQEIYNSFMPIAKSGGAGTTSVDSIVGQYTSQYTFPIDRIDTLKFIQKVNGRITKNDSSVVKSINQTTANTIGDQGVSITQAKEWNKFVDWARKKGYSGNPGMDRTGADFKVVNEYIKEMKTQNPNFTFWVAN